jgi:hypothetical protein
MNEVVLVTIAILSAVIWSSTVSHMAKRNMP